MDHPRPDSLASDFSSAPTPEMPAVSVGETPWARVAFWTSAAIVMAGSIALLSMPGTGDVEMFWLRWMDNITRHGAVVAYRLSLTDYPPLSFAVLGTVTAAADFFDGSHFNALKRSLWLATWTTTLVFYLATRHRTLALGLAASVCLASVGLGYLDVYFMPPFVVALWAIRREWFATGLVLLTATCLIKWQPAILAPPILLYSWHRLGFRRWVWALMPSAILIGACISLAGTDVGLALKQAGSHTYLSGLALNFHWIVTRLFELVQSAGNMTSVPVIEPPASAMVPLKGLFLCLYLIVVIKAQPRSFEECLRHAALCGVVYFAFSPAVHENHLLVVLVPLAWLGAETGRLREFVTAAVVLNLNLAIFFGISGRGPTIRIPAADVIVAAVVVAWAARGLADLHKSAVERRVRRPRAS